MFGFTIRGVLWLTSKLRSSASPQPTARLWVIGPPHPFSAAA
jgi:hypothetical protein